MDAALELAHGSRWSERTWELREGGEARATLRRGSWWKGTWEAAVGDGRWTFGPAGMFRRGLVARAGEDEVAHYEYARGNEDAVVLAGGGRCPVRRPSRMHSERVLCAEDGRDLARLHPRGWKRGIELELGPGGVREPGVALPLLLVCAVLLVERQNQQSAAGGAVAVGATGSF